MLRCTSCNEKFDPLVENDQGEQLNYWIQNKPYKDFKRVCGNCVSKDNLRNSKE